MNYIEIGILFFMISLLASFTGRGGGILYLSVLIHFLGVSTESKIISFILILATSLPYYKMAVLEFDKRLIRYMLLPSLTSYLLMGMFSQKPDGILFLVFIFIIGASSLIYLWFPVVLCNQNNNPTGKAIGYYSLFASGISAYVGLSPALLLIPYLANKLKVDMKKAIPYLHFQNMIVVTLGLFSTMLKTEYVQYPSLENMLILIAMVLLGSYAGKHLLFKSSLIWNKIIFTVLSIASLVLTFLTVITS